MGLAASDIFYFVVTLSMIVIAGAVTIGVYFFLGVLKELQELIEHARVEMETLRSKRREFELSGRTAFKVAALVARWLIFRKK